MVLSKDPKPSLKRKYEHSGYYDDDDDDEEPMQKSSRNTMPHTFWIFGAPNPIKKIGCMNDHYEVPQTYLKRKRKNNNNHFDKRKDFSL